MSTPSARSLFHHQPATREGEIALRAAIRAGTILERKFYEAREVRFKGYRDIVTDADFAANRAARVVLERAFPAHAILSEEDPAPVTNAEFTWMIDPLDGTTNYARRLPIFAVSIALTRRGQPLLGVVYDPVRRECFYAERGRGAFLNGQAVRASRVASIADAVVGFELARMPPLRARGLALFSRLERASVTARIGGAAALSLCYVGAGRLDAYLQLSLAPWDVAAGILFVREGGGRVAHLDGSTATLRGGGYVAAAPRLFDGYLDQLRQWNGDAK